MSKQSKRRTMARRRSADPRIMAAGTRFRFTSPIEFAPVEAAGDDASTPKIRKFSGTAYTSGKMQVATYYYPVVIDLAGVLTRSEEFPALLQHDEMRIVGHIDQLTITAQQIKIAGLVSGAGEAAEEVKQSADNGFPWKLSVGFYPTKVEYVAEGATAKANGRTFNGPCNILRGGTLEEVSFVSIAADAKTSVKVAATAQPKRSFTMPPFAQWVQAEFDLDVDNLTEAQRGRLLARYNADLDDETAATQTQAAATAVNAGTTPPAGGSLTAPADPVIDYRTRIAAESERIGLIQAEFGNEFPQLQAAAIRDGWDLKRVQAELKRERELRDLRAARPRGPAIHNAPGAPGDEVIQAAFCRTAGMKNLENTFKPEVLEAAQKLHGFGIQELLLHYAAQAGYIGRQRITEANLREVMRAAFSTHTLTTLLTTTGNKILEEGFNAIPQSWREVAAVRPVNDFKQVTAFRLTASLEYEELGPAGEIKHGNLGQDTYTLQAKTYARMLTLTRTDIINDDLGAFNDLRNRLGIGAAIKMNKVFWTVWLAARNGAAFWTAARGNLVTSAALGESGLNLAVAAFRNMAGPDGNLLALEPDRIVIPSALEATGRKLYASQEIRDTTASTKTLTANIYQNRFRPVVVPELGNSNYTGYSATSWHLAANPAILASAVMCFLNGKESPTIESSEADFDTLGVQMRGYHDFGPSMSEYQASVEAQA